MVYNLPLEKNWNKKEKSSAVTCEDGISDSKYEITIMEKIKKIYQMYINK